MKIGVVCHSDSLGGAERYLHSLYEAESANASHLLGEVPGWQGRSTALHLSKKWSRKTLLSGLLRSPGEIKKLRKALGNQDFDLFHLQFKREQILFTKLLSQLAPVVWTEHGRIGSSVRRLMGSAYAAAARHVSAIICVSDEVASDVRALVGPRVRVEVIRNRVDISHFRPPSPQQRRQARESIGIPADSKVAAWVGRMEPGKLPLLAVEVVNAWEGWLIMAGTGSLKNEVSMATISSERVKLLGHCDPLSVYHAADVFLFTSTGEGLPLSILEATASGLNVVANRESGMMQLLHEFDGQTLHADAAPSEWASCLSKASSAHLQRRARNWAESLGGAAEWREEHWDLMLELKQGSQNAR